MLRREKQLKRLEKLAERTNYAQTLYYVYADDEGDLFVVFLQDAETMDVLRIFNGNYKECVSFIHTIPIIKLCLKS